MQQIKEYDVKLLRDILEYWNTLSEDTNALDCMTDHCHVEYWDGIELANRLEAIVRRGDSSADENCDNFIPYVEILFKKPRPELNGDQSIRHYVPERVAQTGGKLIVQTNNNYNPSKTIYDMADIEKFLIKEKHSNFSA